MPVFIAALVGGLVSAAGSFVGRVFIALGFGVLVFSGLSVAVEAGRAAMLANLSGLPAMVVGILGLMKVGTGVNIIFSAMAARLLIAGLSAGGTVKKFGFK